MSICIRYLIILEKKWTKLCLYSLCYIICLDYKYENGVNCYIFNTLVHVYLQYVRVWISPLSNALCRLFQHSVWGDRCAQSHQMHSIAQSLSWWVFGGMNANVQLRKEHERWLEFCVPLICIWVYSAGLTYPQHPS